MAFYKIRPRSGTKEQWEYSNPILAEREIGFEYSSNGLASGEVKMKMGNGITPWKELPYSIDVGPLLTEIENLKEKVNSIDYEEEIGNLKEEVDSLKSSSIDPEPVLLWSGEQGTGAYITLNDYVDEFKRITFVFKRNDGFFHSVSFLVSTLLKTTTATGVQQIVGKDLDTTIYVDPSNHSCVGAWMSSNLQIIEIYGHKC